LSHPDHHAYTFQYLRERLFPVLPPTICFSPNRRRLIFGPLRGLPAEHPIDGDPPPSFPLFFSVRGDDALRFLYANCFFFFFQPPYISHPRAPQTPALSPPVPSFLTPLWPRRPAVRMFGILVTSVAPLNLAVALCTPSPPPLLGVGAFWVHVIAFAPVCSRRRRLSPPPRLCF